MRLYRVLGLLVVGLSLGAVEARAEAPTGRTSSGSPARTSARTSAAYGDDYAVTPNLDRLAARGVRYANAFATIGVCAPARSTIITGMYPPSIGTQHMRCQGLLPEEVRLYPAYLRDAGYYCTNNSRPTTT